jgi:prepilin-type N-terminal cleavage/methylation domain-containing protein
MKEAALSQAGFTLIELVIAITLASLAALLGAGVLRTGVDFYDRARVHMRQQDQIRGTARVVRTELEGVQPQQGGFTGRTDAIDFATTRLPRGVANKGLQRVTLLCEEHDNGEWTLSHQAVPDKPSPPSPERDVDNVPQPPEILAEGLGHCGFEFLGRQTREGKSETFWADSWKPEGSAPLAVRLMLTTRGGRVPPIVFPLGQG